MQCFFGGITEGIHIHPHSYPLSVTCSSFHITFSIILPFIRFFYNQEHLIIEPPIPVIIAAIISIAVWGMMEVSMIAEVKTLAQQVIPLQPDLLAGAKSGQDRMVLPQDVVDRPDG